MAKKPIFTVYLTVQTDEEGSSRIQKKLYTNIQPTREMLIPATEEADIILRDALSLRSDLVTDTISLIYLRDPDTITTLLEADDWEMVLGDLVRV